jgi:hypothetical protein
MPEGSSFRNGTEEDGRLLPQTIPHPIRDEAAKRMGHPPNFGFVGEFEENGRLLPQTIPQPSRR